MTPKEALFIVANPNGVSRVQLAIASNIIKTIVAKAEPMEVIKGGSSWGRYSPFCPKCDYELTFTDKENFCPHCGQSLDWSDEK